MDNNRPRRSAMWTLADVANVILKVVYLIIAAITSFFESVFGIDKQRVEFTELFQQAYGPNRPPPFFRGTFREAEREAARRRSLLVVYVHSDIARFTDDFCRNVLCNSEVCRILEDRTQFVLWGSCESKELRTALRPTVYPHVSILLPHNPQGFQNPVARVEGETSAVDFASTLVGSRHVLENYKELLTPQVDRDRALRLEQDREYERALLADSISQQKVMEERQAVDRHRREQEEAGRREAARVEALRERRKALARSIQETAASETQVGFARICVRLPNGRRLERPFRFTACVSEIYDWVEASPYLPEMDVAEHLVSKNFRLTAPLGKTLLRSAPQSIENLGLTPDALLFLVPEE